MRGFTALADAASDWFIPANGGSIKFVIYPTPRGILILCQVYQFNDGWLDGYTMF